MISELTTPEQRAALASQVADRHAQVLATKPKGWRAETRRLAKLYRRLQALN